MNNSRKKTLAMVLRRTDFGEADRILTLLTPEGKKNAIARGVRRPKSKLAGGIEFFSLNEVVLIEGKSEMKTLSSARMCEFFGEILKDFERTEFAYYAIKKISGLCEQIESGDFFEILLIIFRSLNNSDIDLNLIKKWFNFKVAEFSGDEINLESDKNGKFGANDIKFLRLMVSSEPKIISKIKGYDIFLNKVTDIIRSLQ